MADHPLATPESILIDGPNGVTGAPRAGFPERAPSLGLGLVVALLVALLLRTRAPRGLLVVLLAMGAGPGLVALSLRADAPHRRGALAAVVSAGLSDLARVAPGPVAPVTLVRDDADVLFPLSRYTWPSRPVEDAGTSLHIDLRGPSLTTACRASLESPVIVCGVGP